jgi:hypothetical protein
MGCGARKAGKTRQNTAFLDRLILKDLAEKRTARPKNEKGGRGSAAQRTQNYTEVSLVQNEKKAREIVQWSGPFFRVTAADSTGLCNTFYATPSMQHLLCNTFYATPSMQLIR